MVCFKIKKRARNTHKGDYGHLLVIAGSLGMTGAAYMCCEAALISGAGLITLGMPKSLNSIMERRLTEQMTFPLPETAAGTLSAKAYKDIIVFAKKCDCLAIGPGLSSNKQTQALIRSLIGDLNVAMVVYADGLNALTGHLEVFKKRRKDGSKIAITPHIGEMARLAGKKMPWVKKNKKNLASSFASEYNVTTVLKGYRSIVASPGRKIYINSSGNPGMASAGCGDVLTGIIAAFLASGMDSFKAARLGCYVHGLAGDIAARERSEVSLRATDLLKFLPQAFKKIYG